MNASLSLFATPDAHVRYFLRAYKQRLRGCRMLHYLGILEGLRAIRFVWLQVVDIYAGSPQMVWTRHGVEIGLATEKIEHSNFSSALRCVPSGKSNTKRCFSSFFSAVIRYVLWFFNKQIRETQWTVRWCLHTRTNAFRRARMPWDRVVRAAQKMEN